MAAAWLLTTVWCLLLLGGVLRPGLGSEAALLASYACCAALLLASRPRPRGAAAPAACGLAFAAGFVALPGWLVFISLLGCALGLAPGPAPRVESNVCAWLSHVGLAPLFEELLYRERLLPALRARVGAPLALLLSSALFAVPHLDAWSMLTTFCVGSALGGVFLATRRAPLCVAYHAGSNAAVLVCGLPPLRAALAPPLATLAGAALLGLACRCTRGHAGRQHVHARLREHAVPRPRRA